MERVPEYLTGILLFILTENCTEIDPILLLSMFD